MDIGNIGFGVVIGVVFSESIRALYRKYVAPKLAEIESGGPAA